MHRIKTLLLASSILAGSTFAANAQINVVASIKPVHSLVAAVMEGVGEPDLIVDGAASPHAYAMKPSQARMLEKADVIFWVGHELEAFLEKPLETAGANARSVELVDAHDLIKLGFREGGSFEKHGHAGEDHDEHDDHGHNDHDDHDHEAGHDHEHDKDHDHDHDEAAEAGHDHEHEEAKADDHDHDHDHGHEHAHGEFDPHVWLDPVNAKAMVHEIEEALADADPANAAKYEANAEATMAKIDALISSVDAELEPVRDRGYIVFHDAYQYFESRFGVAAAGSITVSPEVVPGAKRVSEIRAKVRELGAACVFAEPQFEPKLIATVIEGTEAKPGVLDPLGAGIANGPDLYFQLIENLAASMKACLTQGS